MEHFSRSAGISVGRAVFFGGLAITLVMMGLAFDYALALRTGAILTLIMSVALLWFGQTAFSRKAERTEAWLLLAEKHRPRTKASLRVFQQVMQDTFYFYSLRAFAIAMLFLATSLLLMLSGVEAGLG